MSEYFDIGKWVSEKMSYHKIADFRRVKGMQVNQGEIWQCDLGFNIGEEKNKKRPVVILSTNSVNRTGKVLVAPITDAKGNINQHNLPQHNTWYLLYSNTSNPLNMFNPRRTIPKNGVTYPELYKDSIIQCEEMRSLSKARLLSKKGKLTPVDLSLLQSKIKNVFDII